VGNGHVVLRMGNDSLDLDLLARVGEGVATRYAQLNGPVLQVNHAIAVNRKGILEPELFYISKAQLTFPRSARL